jgi:hypothetical protein
MPTINIPPELHIDINKYLSRDEATQNDCYLTISCNSCGTTTISYHTKQCLKCGLVYSSVVNNVKIIC